MLYIHLTCHVVNVRLGGAGLYGSTKDYLTFLRHLLLVKGKENCVAQSQYRS